MNFGFIEKRRVFLSEIQAVGVLYVHKKTKAQLISLESDDENKSFGVTFRTPPANSSGVAHILEHSVLCGSKKYPLKEPFVELVKGSLHTFLNALTYPDKTSYPVASQNTQDFYNLIDVYLDAVFFPRISKETFAQEGWHYDIEHTSDPLQYKGVVFNEMKGSYSSEDRLLFETVQQSLLPDTIYAHDSGGDPRKIPSLTYEEFAAFHHTYYQPSNAYFFFSGNDDPQKRLQIVDEFIRNFSYSNVDSTIHLQPALKNKRTVVRKYPVSQPQKNKHIVTVNWLFPEIVDTKLQLALEIIEYILLGSSASPLHRALIESGLGEDIAGFGLESEMRQMAFSTGLKGVAADDTKKVESLIKNTLQTLVRDGFDTKDVTAAVNTIEFHLREMNTGSFPRGLSLMFSSLSNWLYDRDPFAPLQFEAPLKEIKDSIAKDPSYVTKILDTYFVQNTHQTTVILEPDTELAAKIVQAEIEELAAYKKTLSQSQLEGLVATTKTLRTLQETPDSKEALATLPSLHIRDIDPLIQHFPKSLDDRWICHDIFTSGIVYLDVGFSVHTVPEKLLPYLPLFLRSLFEFGTKNHSYISLQQQIHTNTGGITGTILPSTRLGTHEAQVHVFLRAKCLTHQSKATCDLIRQLLSEQVFANKDRCKQILLEEKASMESVLVDSGHRVVSMRIASMYSQSDYLGELFGGISQLQFVRSLLENFDQQWEKIQQNLQLLEKHIVTIDNLLCNLTCERSQWAAVKDAATCITDSLTSRSQAKQEWTLHRPITHEILVAPTAVNYVGKGSNLYTSDYTYHGSHAVITRYLRTTWLWEQVRVKGGAYGGFCSLDWMSGVYSFASYRDPRLLETIMSFDATADFLQNTTIGPDECTKAVIGAISDIDQYRLPDAKGWTSLLHHLTGITDEIRQLKRDEMLSTSSKDFQAFSAPLRYVAKTGTLSILTSQDKIEGIRAAYPDAEVIEVL